MSNFVEEYPHRIGDYVQYFDEQHQISDGGKIKRIDHTNKTCLVGKKWVPLSKCIVQPKLGDIVVWNRKAFASGLNKQIWMDDNSIQKSRDYFLQCDRAFSDIPSAIRLGFAGVLKQQPYWGELFKIVWADDFNFIVKISSLSAKTIVEDGENPVFEPQEYLVPSTYLVLIKR